MFKTSLLHNPCHLQGMCDVREKDVVNTCGSTNPPQKTVVMINTIQSRSKRTMNKEVKIKEVKIKKEIKSPKKTRNRKSPQDPKILEKDVVYNTLVAGIKEGKYDIVRGKEYEVNNNTPCLIVVKEKIPGSVILDLSESYFKNDRTELPMVIGQKMIWLKFKLQMVNKPSFDFTVHYITKNGKKKQNDNVLKDVKSCLERAYVVPDSFNFKGEKEKNNTHKKWLPSHGSEWKVPKDEVMRRMNLD
eukprot:CAMPEP_0206279634 /NCGR_PEP_ID=MMETSP0047_2-20121206/38120_1 /ASSEMBLY_ACC=CAM_ASM_000192 /TAXON_ID=195065 /ORGANISM="Chroomonas mesostigmatica_cf, Strain CCMP1168" /LENGTH=244 /DNA_ID=CAMNT_0053709583 /DNA_START=13 /DNA_END=747 /DNA_ORIENTATION=-